MLTPKKISVLFFALICSQLSSIAQVKKPDSLQLFFDSAKHTITPEHQEKIAAFFKNIQTDDVQRIRIKGYTDFVGNHVYNNKLSKKRANSAYQYIISNYSFKAIAQQGLGEVDDEDEFTEVAEGNSQHRKVDIILSYEPPKRIQLNLTRKQKYLARIPTLSKGEKIRLKNIFFQISTAIPVKDSKEDIDGLYKVLKAYPKLKFEIQGHVCCGTKEEYESKEATEGNLKLSTNRAKAVYNGLLKKGIKESRLNFIGHAFTRPLEFPEDTVDKQKENRRIEIKIVSK
ncbi:OmpA family protein [Pseudofulvibacter geojedonensis]|uniref:OmpA family protein n=1 Tax=Pseudofulvibacter geojedonensis TaxID=1123758 RepID=A0ABW3HZB2_9FLAO